MRFDNSQLFHKLTSLLHELAQPMMAAKTYTFGTAIRLKENQIAHDKILHAVENINRQLELMGDKIQELKDYLNLLEHE